MSTALLKVYMAAFLMLPQPTLQYTNNLSRAAEAKTFLEHQNELLRQRIIKEKMISYNYNTNVTETNRLAMIAVAAENAKVQKELALLVKELGYMKLDDENLSRQAKYLSRLSLDVLPEDAYKKLQNAISSMQTNYATAKVCAFGNPTKCDLSLEPHINERLRKCRDPKELAYYWQAWYDVAGTPMRGNFKTFVDLSRKAAHLNNCTSYAEDWISYYEDTDFEKNLDAAYEAILPLYREIHGYIRHRLREYYGPEVVPAEGNIPMHLLGDMWGQQWDETLEICAPFQKPFVDIDAQLQVQGYTVEKLFRLGDDFFKSLNLRALPDSFWNLSVIERPSDREIVCHPSAWDMYNARDVRIKMCAEVNMYYLNVVHHEMGHIQYFLQYENQPVIFRAAPNPGFHEAIGDVIALSALSPKHLKLLGLLPNEILDEQTRINELFKMALKKVVFLPFAYTLDKYRFAIYRGNINESVWNTAFWQMRSKFSGVEPPVKRTEVDFDPPAKLHVAANVEYLRYFAAHIFQFQFHKALCIKAGQFDPNDNSKNLDNCDIYGSKEAGKHFAEFLSLGASKHWKKALSDFTGETTMDPSALLEYFKLLHTWLRNENRRLGVPLGWNITDKATLNAFI